VAVSQSESQQPAPPRRSHGCLFSCLALVVIAILAFGGAFLYGSWNLFQGFKNDPKLEQAMVVVRADHTAQEVLGDHIEVESLESETFTSTTGAGTSSTYTAMLKGTKGEGQLHVTFHTPKGKQRTIVAIVLTAPDGSRYNLTNKSVSGAPQDSI
jgi:hypothetical protein